MSVLKPFTEHGLRVLGTKKKLFRRLASTMAALFNRHGVFNAGCVVGNPCCEVNCVCAKW